MEFIKMPYLERFIGYADEVHMSDNLDKVRLGTEDEMELVFKDDDQGSRYCVIGVFKGKEILMKEPYREDSLEYLLGQRDDLVTLLVIDEEETRVFEFDQANEQHAYEKIKEILKK
ncbi:hypothetical protein HNQ80_001724 [Anaerosolibacter carboniphilus]|uniref:DUF1292 domain-containing protein n=1 Tax=Anaerosolibacter carboniphilus TaxID=1417629 RepID=A0A841KZS9_9FIRM|nr:hypothetical protein [Anaerosolibacter carboniphilus]MBB6215635.1 hypothetical protein [Anaerosolibacter carboniphilus]